MKKYLLHNKRYCEYQQAQEDLNKVLDEWVLAFQKTQPKATTYGDKVQTSITKAVSIGTLAIVYLKNDLMKMSCYTLKMATYL